MRSVTTYRNRPWIARPPSPIVSAHRTMWKSVRRSSSWGTSQLNPNRYPRARTSQRAIFPSPPVRMPPPKVAATATSAMHQAAGHTTGRRLRVPRWTPRRNHTSVRRRRASSTMFAYTNENEVKSLTFSKTGRRFRRNGGSIASARISPY